MQLNERENVHFEHEHETHVSSKHYEDKWLRARFGNANHHALICMFHIQQEVGAEIKVSI